MTPIIITILGIVLTAAGAGWTIVSKAEQTQLLTKQNAYIAHQTGVVNDMRTQRTDAQVKAAKAREDSTAMAGYVKTLLARLQAEAPAHE